ncbi:MAG: hypothetical protein HZA30_05180 [Candidatus Omnitrophica bacterium]|nr:hypothetical protein [Candidatus Omnitrophota bacterium]
MDRKKLELIVTAVSVLIFIFMLSNSLKRKGPRVEPSAPQTPAETSIARQPEFIFGVKKEMETKDIIDPKRPWGRDPFILQEIAQGSLDDISNLKLMGITAGEKARPMAIINNEIVSAGSEIGKFKVLKISKDRVIVSDGEKDYELKISQ